MRHFFLCKLNLLTLIANQRPSLCRGIPELKAFLVYFDKYAQHYFAQHFFAVHQKKMEQFRKIELFFFFSNGSKLIKDITQSITLIPPTLTSTPKNKTKEDFTPVTRPCKKDVKGF